MVSCCVYVLVARDAKAAVVSTLQPLTTVLCLAEMQILPTAPTFCNTPQHYIKQFFVYVPLVKDAKAARHFLIAALHTIMLRNFFGISGISYLRFILV